MSNIFYDRCQSVIMMGQECKQRGWRVQVTIYSPSSTSAKHVLGGGGGGRGYWYDPPPLPPLNLTPCHWKSQVQPGLQRLSKCSLFNIKTFLQTIKVFNIKTSLPTQRCMTVNEVRVCSSLQCQRSLSSDWTLHLEILSRMKGCHLFELNWEIQLWSFCRFSFQMLEHFWMQICLQFKHFAHSDIFWSNSD